MSRRFALTALVLILLVIGLLPLGTMFIKSIVVDGQISLSSYKGLMSTENEWILIGHSVSLALFTALLTITIGLPLGILLSKTDLPFAKMVMVLFTVPLLIPPYITAISWFHLLGRAGLLSRYLSPEWAKLTSDWLFGFPGCVLVLVTTYLPVVMLLTIAFLKTVPPQLEEAARLVSHWWNVLYRITIPLILPGVLLAGGLVFLLTLGEFGVPSYLRYSVFAVESYTRFSAFYNFESATAATLPLLIITFLLLILERIFLRKKTAFLRPAPGADHAIIIPLGSSKKWILGLVSILCFVLVVLPLLVLFVQSLSVEAWMEAVTRSWGSLLRSIIFAAIGASCLTMLGFFTGYFIYSRSFRFCGALDSLTIFLFALSGTVIGIGLVSMWNHPTTNFIYSTPLIILLGYLARYTALTSRMTLSSLANIPSSMEEAARVAGAGWFRSLFLITMPLAKRGLIAAWLVAYIFCLRDVGISLLVYPPGYDTLPIRIFTLMANGTGELIAALCVIMILAALLPLGLGMTVLRKRTQ
jgi:iron(III) transport system permease protein